MRALCWFGPRDVRVENVKEPEILNPRDAIVRVTSTAICGSDLHLYNGLIPTMAQGDILGHEFMGEVVDVGPEVEILRTGDRVVIPFPIACGSCFSCQDGFYSCCENSNPNAWMSEKMFGHATCGIFGYSHLTGGYAGGQAELVRVPYADTNHVKVGNGIPDEKVLFLSDVFPTGYMAAENCDIEPGDTVAVWGCGPVGLFAIKSAFLFGAERVIAIDRFPERLRLAREECGATTLDYEAVDVKEALDELTGGIGPDRCIDAVGMEAHMPGIEGIYDGVKQTLMLENDRPSVLRHAIMACKSAGTVSVPGVYGGFDDKIPLGSFMNRAVTLKTGQTHVQRYLQPLLERVENGEIDPSFIISHRMKLADAPRGYEIFGKKQESCTKIVLRP